MLRGHGRVRRAWSHLPEQRLVVGGERLRAAHRLLDPGLAFNMCCRYIHLWMYVIPAADLQEHLPSPRRRPGPGCSGPSIKYALSVNLPVDVCNTCG